MNEQTTGPLLTNLAEAEALFKERFGSTKKGEIVRENDDGSQIIIVAHELRLDQITHKGIIDFGLQAVAAGYKQNLGPVVLEDRIYFFLEKSFSPNLILQQQLPEEQDLLEKSRSPVRRERKARLKTSSAKFVENIPHTGLAPILDGNAPTRWYGFWQIHALIALGYNLKLEEGATKYSGEPLPDWLAVFAESDEEKRKLEILRGFNVVDEIRTALPQLPEQELISRYIQVFRKLINEHPELGPKTSSS